MTSCFVLEHAKGRRHLEQKFAPMIYRSDLFILAGREVSQFTRLHIRAFKVTVPLWSKVTHH